MSTDTSEDRIWVRWCLASCVLVIPGVGFLQWSNAEAYNPMRLRFVLATVATVLLVLSFRSTWVRRRIRHVGFGYGCFATLCFLGVSHQSRMGMDDALGLLPFAAVVPTMVSRRLQLALYSGLSCATLVAVGTLIEPRFSPLVFAVLFGTTSLSVGVMTLSRRTLRLELARLNAGLERAVQDRTSALQSSLASLRSEVREREIAEQRAEAANRAKSDFLATMSHELRTPLNVILGYTEMLAEDLEGQDLLVADLGRVNGSAQHLLRLVDQVLDLAQVEAGALTPDLTQIALRERVLAVVDEVAMVHDHGNEVLIDVPDALSLRSDRLWLTQILTNLLVNAQRFTERGRITVRAQQTAEATTLVVEDTGIGIPPESLESVFERFSQVDGSRTRRHDGAGLGLAVCRELVVALGGTLHVRSVVGEGTAFSASLPR